MEYYDGDNTRLLLVPMWHYHIAKVAWKMTGKTQSTWK